MKDDIQLPPVPKGLTLAKKQEAQRKAMQEWINRQETKLAMTPTQRKQVVDAVMRAEQYAVKQQAKHK